MEGEGKITFRDGHFYQGLFKGKEDLVFLLHFPVSGLIQRKLNLLYKFSFFLQTGNVSEQVGWNIETETCTLARGTGHMARGSLCTLMDPATR
jgi:hypothetical protein